VSEPLRAFTTSNECLNSGARLYIIERRENLLELIYFSPLVCYVRYTITLRAKRQQPIARPCQYFYLRTTLFNRHERVVTSQIENCRCSVNNSRETYSPATVACSQSRGPLSRNCNSLREPHHREKKSGIVTVFQIVRPHRYRK